MSAAAEIAIARMSTMDRFILCTFAVQIQNNNIMVSIRETIEQVCSEVIKGLAQAELDNKRKSSLRIRGGITVDIDMPKVRISTATEGDYASVSVKGIRLQGIDGVSMATTWREREDGREYVD